MSPWLQICRLSGSKIQIAFLGETKRDHSSEPTCLWQSVARRSCPGCRLRHRRAAPATSWTRPSTALCLFRFGLYESNQREVGPPASSKTATPNHVFPAIPGDRNELVECHCEATRGRSPVSPDRPTKIVLRRSVESAQLTAIWARDIRLRGRSVSVPRRAKYIRAPIEP